MKKAIFFFFLILITGKFAFGQSAMTVTGNIGSNINGMEFMHSNLTQGIGIGFNTLYAAGSNVTQDLGLSAKGSTGTLLFSTNGLERMRITGNGNIGIGHSAPNSPLQFSNVFQDRKIVFRELINNTNGYDGFGLNETGLRYNVYGTDKSHVFTVGVNLNFSTEIMRIKGDGRVGIGVTNPLAMLEITRGTNDLAPNGALQINGTTHNSQFNYGAPEDTYIRGGKAGAKVIINELGGLGNVGIGTANPLQKLHVGGSLAVDNNVGIGTTTPAYKLQVKTVGNSYGISHSNGTVDVATYVETPVGAIGTKSNHQFQLYANDGINQFVLTPSGNVGIGIFNPSQKLHVGGNLAVNNYVGIGNTDPHAPIQFSNDIQNRKVVLYEIVNDDHRFFGLGISGGILRYQVGSTDDKHIFYAGTGESSSNELMRIVGNGNVGIGVTEPGAMLEIARGTAATAPTGSLQVNGTTYASHFSYGTLEDTYIRGGKAGAHVLINDYAEHGNVGIGTSTPTEKLDVNGNVDISGSLEIGYLRVFGNVVTVFGLTYGSASCNCTDGRVAIGGGFIVNDNGTEILKSYANGDSSWTVYMYNAAAANRTLQAFAICARLAN